MDLRAVFTYNIVSFIFYLFSGLRTIVNSLFRSMKPLAEVMFIMLFLVVVVALIGLQAYRGVLRRRCVRTPDIDEISSGAAWTSYVRNRSKSV